MRLEEFKNNFDRMVQAFSPTRPDDKAKVYFQELSRYDGEVFRKVCDDIIRGSEKFPTISTLISMIGNKNPVVKNSKAKCDACNGWGWVSKYGTAYRSYCEHGQALSKTIATWPSSLHMQKGLLRKQAEQEMDVYGEWPKWAVKENLFPEEYIK